MGYIGMYLSFEEASITNVAVAPAHRKKGCGEKFDNAEEGQPDPDPISIFIFASLIFLHIYYNTIL